MRKIFYSVFFFSNKGKRCKYGYQSGILKNRAMFKACQLTAVILVDLRLWAVGMTITVQILIDAQRFETTFVAEERIRRALCIKN